MNRSFRRIRRQHIHEMDIHGVSRRTYGISRAHSLLGAQNETREPYHIETQHN